MLANYTLPGGEHDFLPDNVPIDDVGGYIGNGQYQVERSGFYLFAGRAFLGTASSSTSARLAVAIGGVSYIPTQGAPGTGPTSLNLTTTLELNVNDIVSMRLFRHATGSTTVTSTYTGWSLVRIGPVRWT